MHAGPPDHKGKIIGAAEGNKEMADRHHGFGAYDVPFLGPMRTRRKDQSEHAADAEVIKELICSMSALEASIAYRR